MEDLLADHDSEALRIQHWKQYNFSEYVQASGEGLTGPGGPPLLSGDV